MKKHTWALLLIGGAILLAGCGAVPLTVDLSPILQKAEAAQGSFSQPLSVPPGTKLDGLDGQTFFIPSEEGLAVSFEVPDLPKTPTSMTFEYAARVDYTLTCVENLEGELTARAFLAGESPPWNTPIEGSEVRIPLQSEGHLNLEGTAWLSPEQLQAVLSGKVVLGLQLSLESPSGVVLDNCTPEIQGTYKIERAVLKIQFF